MRGRALSLALDSLVRPNSVRCRDIDIQIYRRGSPHATAALALGSLPIPVYRCPNVLACQRSNYVSLPERLTPLKKKKPARRGLAGHGGDSEATLSEGIRLRVMGCARPEGVGRSALRASADVLSIVNAPSLSSHERKPQTVGETASIEIASSQGQGAASLSTTWIVRRVRQPRATLWWLSSTRYTVFFTYPKGVSRVFPLVRLLCFFFLGRKLIVNRVCYHSP